MGRAELTVVWAAVFIGLGVILSSAGRVNAEQSNITQSDAAIVVNAQSVSSGGTFTQSRAFTPLSRTTSQSVQVQGTGTSPNYKVQLLVSIDGTTFVLPEVGGELGTFTDANAHIVALSGPLCVGHKLKFTELGSHTLTVTAWEISQ